MVSTKPQHATCTRTLPVRFSSLSLQGPLCLFTFFFFVHCKVFLVGWQKKPRLKEGPLYDCEPFVFAMCLLPRIEFTSCGVLLTKFSEAELAGIFPRTESTLRKKTRKYIPDLSTKATLVS